MLNKKQRVNPKELEETFEELDEEEKEICIAS
jgi:hypothetical protein